MSLRHPDLPPIEVDESKPLPTAHMNEGDRRAIERIKRMRGINRASMILYNGEGAQPGSGHSNEQWAYADGSAVRASDLASHRSKVVAVKLVDEALAAD